MNLWSVPRSQPNGGLKRIVEVARFFPDRTLVRIDEPWRTTYSNLTFLLCRALGPPKEDLLTHLATVRFDLTQEEQEWETPLPYVMWDVVFEYIRNPLSSEPAFLTGDPGRVRWFFDKVGVALLESEFDVSTPDLESCRLISRAPPVPGHLFVSEDELEIYAALGEPPPFLWTSFDDFFSWASERSDARLFTTGG